MKKNFIYAMLGAIALTGAVGLTSCADSEELAEVNPGYNPETGEVPVDFVFNVSTANEPFTRMTAANTQAKTTYAFRGITDAYLATYKLADDGKYLTTSSDAADKLYSLGPVIDENLLNPNQEASGDVTKSRRVLQLTLASGTNTMLFWGKAPKTGTNLDQGKITMDIKETPSNTTISMCKIVPETAYEDSPNVTQAALAQYQNLITKVLTNIINSGVSGKEISFGEETKTINLKWKDYAVVSGEAGSYTLSKPVKDPSDNTKDLSLLGERLAYTFVQLNTIHASELRAGCGLAVSNMISDLMANINQVVTATPLNLEEAAAQEVAKAIKTAVETFFTSSNNEYTWLGTSTVKSKADFVLDDDKKLVTDSYNLNNFPAESFNLPLGSTILELDIKAETAPATGYSYTYQYAGTVDTYAMGGSSGSATTAFDPKNYMFPAELCYFGNSSVRVTNDTKVASDYPDGVTNWDNSSNWANWYNTHVVSSTRSVAMKDNINYGTALLKSQVRYGTKTLEDNNHNLQLQWSNNVTNEPNNTINVDERDDHFLLTGILVGGQNPDVGWNYIAKGNTTGFGAMVYDRAKRTDTNGNEVYNFLIPQAKADNGGNASEALYTLLWDNWDATLYGKKQRDVYVAVEFKNNSKNFYGENNLIRNGATFYIVGKLNPDKIKKSETEYYTDEEVKDLSLGITWPTNYALPPYETTGENIGKSIKQRRVFIQDFMTTATFVIGSQSLQHALVAVPDLRSGQISLGLSVDLEWRTGLNFGDVILGQ